MTLTVSPALTQVESALKVSPGSFAKNNYRSVFDIANTSRKQFIADNMSWLGLRGGRAWDLAIGQAQHIRRLFREKQLTRQIRTEVQRRTLSGQKVRNDSASSNIQGLVQDGPTWQNQFAENWQSYCQSGAPEAVDSPVSYLTWLYKQALNFEEEIQASSTAEQVITLADRRPDLATLTVDNDAVNQQIPALQLVNEILENNIATSLPAEQSVDKTLAGTRYPTLLPYHFPHDQVELSLHSADVQLEEIIGQAATDWPWFLNDSWQGTRSNTSTELASRLAPEQQTLVTEPDNSIAPDLTTFYKTNLGVETADYTPFENLDTFTRQLGITVPQAEALVAGNGEGSTSVVVSPNINDDLVNTGATSDVIDSSYYGADFINHGEGEGILSLVDMTRYNASHIPQDTGSTPVPLSLSSDGITVVEGRFNTGLRCDATQSAEMYIADNISTDGSELKDFTITFWCKISSDVKDMAVVITNKTSNYALSPKGITLFARHDGSAYTLELTASDGKNDPLTLDVNFTPDVWVFLAIRYSGSDKLYLRASTDGKNMNFVSSIDFSALDNIALSQDCWGFNGNKGNNYYNSYPERRSIIDYDDITSWNRGLSDDEIEKFITSNKPAAGYSGMYHYYALDGSTHNLLSGVSNARMDRINRMVRLQRWLGLSYEETDLLLSACIRAQGADNTDYSLNAHTLRALGVFRHWQQKYGVTAFQFAAVLDAITPYAISPAVPFLDQVFNSPSLFDEPFAITGETVSYTGLTGNSARTVRQICAGLEITQAQFRVLADRVAAEQGNTTNKTFPLTLPVVSALYRLVMVPRWLGLSFAEGAALLSLAGSGDAAWSKLAGVPQLAALTNGQPVGGDILDLLMALDAAAGWAAEHKLSWVKSWLALQPGTDALVATSATVNFVNGIRQQLPASLLSEQSFSSVALPEYNSCVNIHSGSTPADSPLGKAHGIELDSTQGQYAVFTDTADTLITGSSSYTIGMWVKVTSGASVNFPVIANASAYNQSTSPGIFISLGSSYHLQISVASDDPDSPVISNSSSTSWQIDKWFWLAIATDVTQQTVTVYAYSEDGSITSSIPLSYKGSILTESGNNWALSQNGALNNTGTHGNISYDDITVWDSVLTAENIKAIVASGMPATFTLPATLPTLVADTDFLSDLIDNDGLVLPVAADYDTIVTMVSADIDAAHIIFASEAEREQAISSLSNIIWQARQAQNGVADSALAQMFSTAQSLPPFLLQWAGDSEYRLLADSLTMNNGAALTDPSQVPASYLTKLFALGQRAGISTAFTLTPATLSVFLAHPDWFGVPDTALTLTLLYRFSRYGDWLKAAGEEDRVLAYLSWANGTTPPDASQAAEALALLLAWESSEVADATAGLPDAIAKTTADVDYVMRLQQLSVETGLSVTPLLATGELAPGSVIDTWDAWQSAGESLVAAQSGQQ
ncbi:Tc toxin subunit A [Pseudescherichia sp.]|uniref:Tc toxin subunit A n=1 Tax=Pseudescherichia sp. TaxID=2055881 RepID=UPI0028A1411B|nr:Tc toxin subunit A [Pseudescherichia sp.]